MRSLDELELRHDLLLVGGGHAHALVLRQLGMRPLAGGRVTLVSPASWTPYSGMLPGLVAGHYGFEDSHIDLSRLCGWAGVRFIAATVIGWDPEARRLEFADRPALSYDLLSLDIGSQPEMSSVPGARKHAVPVKPVADFWARWQSLRNAMEDRADLSIAVVGGGAGSVELSLAIAWALREHRPAMDLYCGGEMLGGSHPRLRRAARRACAALGVRVHERHRAGRVDAGVLHFEHGGSAPFDELLWCTGASAAPWIAASGLPVDERGFLAVGPTLQSLADDRVFAAGDIATQPHDPSPKAGVYAVRQGPVLAHNLRCRLEGRVLRNYRPQRRFLSLLSLGPRRAAAERGPFAASGAWAWHWKDRIDRAFMRRFQKLPVMNRRESRSGSRPAAAPPCGGCGAKVAGHALASALSELAKAHPVHCRLVAGAAVDAAELPAADAPLVQSTDSLRALVGDPFVMGRLAANHALSDLHACGARPVAALAQVTLPFATPVLQQRELLQLLSGALEVLRAADCVLIGGHSMQGPELQLGFAVTGSTPRLGKRGGGSGSQLVLTKALGTGVLFAAQMQPRAAGRDLDRALAIMLESNGTAMDSVLSLRPEAATDVTGFGLAGHLLELLPDGCGARLRLGALPLLPGAARALAAGLRSTAHEANRASVASELAWPDAAAANAARDILFDPQTGGGLLLAFAPDTVTGALAALQSAGVAATCIGELVDSAPGAPRILVEP